MKKGAVILTSLAMLAWASCSKNANESPVSGNSKVQLVLTDAPAPYDAVNIDIKSISINNSSSDQGWIDYPVNAGIYNLLQYRNGTTVAMGDPISLPAGKIEQIRLVLGDNNTVVVGGQTYPVKTPSAQQSGYKINFHKELSPDGVYKIWLDFDAARSIVQTGNGKYILKPVVRAFSEETNGQIRGWLLPAEALITVYAIKGTDSLTALPDYSQNGMFKFVGLSDGTYKIAFNAVDSTGYKDSVLNNVNVVFGKVTDIGTTTLHK